jgi:hypothetical protein
MPFLVVLFMLLPVLELSAQAPASLQQPSEQHFNYTAALRKTLNYPYWTLENTETRKVIPGDRFEYIGWSDDPFWLSHGENLSNLATPIQVGKEAQFYPPYHDVVAFRRNGLWGLMSTAGKIVRTPRYAEIRHFKSGLAMVAVESNEGKKWGVINHKGKEIIPTQYNYLAGNYDSSMFSVGSTAIAAHKGTMMFGVLNAAGKEVIPVKYTAIRQSNDGVYAMRGLDDMWQLMNQEGKPMGPGRWEDVKEFGKSYVIGRKNHKWGVSSPDGKVVVDYLYKSVVPKTVGRYTVTPFTKWQLQPASQAGTVGPAIECDALYPVADTMYGYVIENQHGLISAKGRIIVTPRYDTIAPYRGGLAAVQKEGRWAVLDRKGKELLSDRFDEVALDHEGFFVTRQGDTRSILTLQGKKLLQGEYSHIGPLVGDRFLLEKDGRFGYADKNGVVVVTTQYEDAHPYKGGLALVKANGLWGLLDAKGEWKVKPVFEEIEVMPTGAFKARNGIVYSFITKEGNVVVPAAVRLNFRQDGFVTVRLDSLVGLVQADGKELLPIQYDAISLIGPDSIFAVRTGDQWGLVSRQGRLLMKPSTRYKQMGIMAEGLVPVKIDKRWGFVDKEGRLMIANRYDGLQSFSEGMAAFMLNNKWGFIDKAEKIRVQPHYEVVQPFKNGVALVNRNQKWGMVNKNGAEVIPLEFDKIWQTKTGNYINQKEGKLGLLDQEGRQVILPKYDAIQELPNRHFIQQRNGLLGVADEKGQVLVPMVYTMVLHNPFSNFYLLGRMQDPKDL